MAWSRRVKETFGFPGILAIAVSIPTGAAFLVYAGLFAHSMCRRGGI